MPSGILRLVVAVAILVLSLSFLFQTGFFTFPWLLLRWAGVFLIVLSLVVVARQESANKQPEQEAAITA
jgi:uncharacterized membrane protein